MAILKVEHLNKAFGGLQATSDVNSGRAFARLKEPWQEVPIISLHGREELRNLVAAVRRHPTVAVYTDPKRNPAWLAAGLIAPIITLKKFVVVENTFSVLSGIIQLAREGQWFLFVIISVFSILLPVLKLTVLHRLLGRHCHNAERLRTYLHWMHLYGKWSMLDVFIVAVLVVAVKLGAIAQVEMRYGLYAFATSVLLTMFITARVVALADRVETLPEEQG